MTGTPVTRTLLTDLRAVLAAEPAVAAWAASGGAAMIAAYGFGANAAQQGAVTTIAAALATAWTAWQARPVAVPALTGALVTALTAAGTFGLHLSPHAMAAAAAVLSAVLALAFRANLTPAATIRTAAAARTAGGGAKGKKGGSGG